MPKYNNRFAEPVAYTHRIVDGNGKVIGTLRVKPSSVLWKPANASKYYAVPLQEFVAWITAPTTNAKRVTQ